ncbi:response regulator [Paenibacillus nasutitermitis]|uniref:Response regulator n=1 Tax=Paenibacillus nasutitermitis TaxID=1652958 RepID=A0A916ZIM7_9BACL|nr:response regulator [Paenibacillus nasutitermitis]GGD98718.1 hypothetical protein GCM10010911_66940 [Paenibacillus nasutitermitis]
MFSILIVDDNLSDRAGINGLIDWEALDIEVVGFAVDGGEGYKQAVELRPDFILTDVAMPVMDGIKMTQQIKEELPQTKFIFMSCFDDFEYLKGAINLDVYGYILKPINLSELTETLAKVKNLKQDELEKERNDQKLKVQLQESMPILQEQLIRDLLYGKLGDEDNIRNRMNSLGMDFTNNSYAVLYLQIGNTDAQNPDKTMENRHLTIYSVQKCVEETILSEIPGYVTNQHQDSLAVILFMPHTSDEEAVHQLMSLTNACREKVNHQLGLRITIGISEFSNRLSLLPKLFEDAEYAIKSKFYSKDNQVIMTSKGRYQKVMEDIKAIIDEQYAQIENVNQIVSPLFLSVSHANLIFKQQSGQTIFDYLIKKRMEVAKSMLMDPYIKIYEIAEKTGYKTNSYFASVFKEYTGLTPKQFRDKNRD